MTEESFNIETYFKFIELEIIKILQRKNREELTYDILDTDKIKEYKLLALELKHKQMKIGEIWQVVLGNYKYCNNLKIGHITGLDIISHERKFAMELKNRTNTDNASSKKTNLDKLAKFKKENPDYLCIYGNINDTTKEKTLKGTRKIIIHNGVEIEYLIGYKLLEFVLMDDSYKIIEFIRSIINSYL